MSSSLHHGKRAISPLLTYIYISQVNLSQLLSPSSNVLVLYTPDVDAVIGSDDDKMSIILTGHFNVNFVSEEVKPLIEFLKRALNLTINTDAREGTTRYGTMIDTVFLIDYNRGFSYPTSVTSNLSCLSWKMRMQEVE
ncbi:hypothetical protein TNIN_441111 [Trichonephila inaurata madagascariensis]|uniref:Uncharacterized protein n=1 Tax=Trichonephila inaurata madagascariensis TaxID=2747483 RepID=A0A8X6YP96_9ARAC|nr:hypothetical protein TNIN_411481 [Trichonephila inaurata madagascariensis]GFY74536.1 hypothetical protein TNIN_441111 [Trichonephila inaurata madagascariensis]